MMVGISEAFLTHAWTCQQGLCQHWPHHEEPGRLGGGCEKQRVGDRERCNIVGRNFTLISSRECMRTANDGRRCLILLLPWERSCMNEWEGEMACAQSRDLPTASMLFNVTGGGGGPGFCTVEYLGEGDSCQIPPRWGTAGKGPESPGALSPLATALQISWELGPPHAAAACLRARNSDRKAPDSSLLELNRFPLIHFSISASNLPPTCNNDVLGYGCYGLIKAV